MAGRTDVAVMDDGDGSSQAPQRMGVRALHTRAQTMRTDALAADEAKLLGQFAALKTEFGLTDRYRIEDWRAGRE